LSRIFIAFRQDLGEVRVKAWRFFELSVDALPMLRNRSIPTVGATFWLKLPFWALVYLKGY
jgi:hypothetical protein